MNLSIRKPDRRIFSKILAQLPFRTRISHCDRAFGLQAGTARLKSGRIASFWLSPQPSILEAPEMFIYPPYIK
jgi:hypothetical protein